MGRIKTALIKRVTFKLLDKHKGEFKKDFTENKKLMEGMTNVTSKKLRNIIAGYLTRQMKHEHREKPRAKKKEDLSQFY